MGRRLPVLFFVVVLVAFALGWRSGVFETSIEDPAATSEAAKPEGRERQAALGTPAVPLAPAPAPVAPATAPPADPAVPTPPVAAVKPSFDVVRVEPDGSAVIAGRATPGRSVMLLNGDTPLGEVRSGDGGEFVIDLTLPAGEHRLRLAERDPGAAEIASTLSDEAAVVNVPPKGRANELLVMMERPGQASEILVRPTPAEPQVAEASPSAGGTTATTTEPAQDAQAPALTSQATATATATAAGSVEATTGPERRLAVEAVEIENGRLFIAGSADPRSTIRIYLDDKLVTETRGGEGDRFIGSALAGVAVGDHVIRVDEIGSDGRVVARAEVPFNRPDLGSMSAVASSAGPASPSEQSASVRTDAASAGTASSGVAAPTGTETPTQTTAAGNAASAPLAEAGLRTSVQSPLETVQARVIIRRGDSLWRISRTTYGRGSRYSVIYLANGDQIRDPDRIYPGQVLKLPKDEAGDGQG